MKFEWELVHISCGRRKAVPSHIRKQTEGPMIARRFPKGSDRFREFRPRTVRGMPPPPPREQRVTGVTGTTSASTSSETLPPLRESHLIPNADGLADITLPEEDGVDDYSGLLNDGVGTGQGENGADDPDQPDPALGHDRDDEPSTDANADPEASPKPRRTAHPLPMWLQPFEAHVAASAIRRRPDKLPPPYRDHQTFWFPRPDPFFCHEKYLVSVTRIQKIIGNNVKKRGPVPAEAGSARTKPCVSGKCWRQHVRKLAGASPSFSLRNYAACDSTS
ncbi:hypothetical protein B0H11DRAFT_1939514 [Mycena galericulata]|nr:hypothetical protein B0H11DRAFT_1939514 [Mycena galericulata]